MPTPNTITIDARGKRLGRLASEIASLLQEKGTPGYNPRLAGTTKVRVTNISGIELTGRKATQKRYYKHTGPLGHLKVRTYQDVFAKKPGWVLRHAVNLMLPKNRLRALRMRRLTIE